MPRQMNIPDSFHRPLGQTGLLVAPIVFGTSCLGNLYQVVPDETKIALISEMIRQCPAPVVIDTAGKYGAGLALEVIGHSLRKLGVPQEDVIISNKLGWYRVPLSGPEPTFERGTWAGIGHDAQLRISHDGILQCYEQGCELLGEGYTSQIVSVHDPDEYLAAAKTPAERQRRFEDVLGAYQALFELKARNLVRAVGIGAKDWQVIREIAGHVDLDWVMLACSLTVYSHPADLLDFISHLRSSGVGMINSAVFNAGFLTGGKWFDYRLPDPLKEAHLFTWRQKFFAVCQDFGVTPADACVQFALAVPGIAAVALNSAKPLRIRANVESTRARIPGAFWEAMKHHGLVMPSLPF